MNALYKLLGNVIVILLGTLCNYLAWNHIAPKYFPGLPSYWKEVGFVDMFCLLWSLRILSFVLRAPDVVPPGKTTNILASQDVKSPRKVY